MQTGRLNCEAHGLLPTSDSSYAPGSYEVAAGASNLVPIKGAWNRYGARRIIGFTVLGAFVLFLLAQAVPYGRAHANPPVTRALKFDTATTQELFTGACGDCHSNLTKWPWYTNVAPVSWLVAHDVEDGRARFNVSQWDQPQPDIQRVLKQISSGEMPDWKYKPLHPSAQLSTAQTQALMNGLARSYAKDPPASLRSRSAERAAADRRAKSGPAS